MMRTDIDHLPPGKQRELKRIVEILHEEFDDALKLSTADWKRRGRIQRIILFGSYTRGKFGQETTPGRGWVDEPHTLKGYLSDYDILIIVNHKGLTDIAEYWDRAEDRLILDPAIRPVVNFIVHTQDQINTSLRNSEYFFIDIIKEGIELYKLKGAKGFATPQPLTPEEALQAAQKHFEYWMPLARHALQLADTSVENNVLRDAAFMTHQAVERLYNCILLVLTNYSPNSHNIKFLRSQAERLETGLVEAWPRETKRDRRLFELLKRAYVEARYSEHFTITEEELLWLRSRGDALAKIVKTVSQERIAVLTETAKQADNVD